MIPRIKFSRHLKSHLQQFPVASIISPRQIGKTTLVKLLMEEPTLVVGPLRLTYDLIDGESVRS